MESGQCQVTPTAGPRNGVLASMVLSRQALEAWPAKILASGARVVAPVATGQQVEYRELSAAAPAATGFSQGLPRLSPKASWFPRTEPILQLRRQDRQWSVSDPELGAPTMVLFGVRPCDAAAPAILAPLFGWDFHDPFFERRLPNIATIVLACSGPVDGACFCTSVGTDPAGENLGDVLLTPLEGEQFLAEARTARGKELLALAEPAAGPGPEAGAIRARREAVRRAVPVRFEPKQVEQAIRARFNDPLWEQSSRACIACGTCAFSCPTCHCFDIQDERTNGTVIRQKNWDTCASPLFTLHTSGHNPRPDQAARWRQRLSHKFRYYPEKFGHVLCTGCGRCLRLCPVGMDMLADLTTLAATPPAEVAAVPQAPAADAALPTPGTPAGTAADSPNIYRPYVMQVADVRDETPDVRTLRLEFTDPQEAAKFSFRVGQFGLYSAFGEGESTFCIASSSTRKGYIECTFRQAGRVTRALRRLSPGDLMGFRGPYGNSFPVEAWKGKDLLFIAGGIALPPMRSVIQYCLDNRGDYGDITIIYGARTWADHVYKGELAEWEARPDVRLWLCIDWKMGPNGPVEAPAMEGWPAINLKAPEATVLDLAHRRYTGFVPQMVSAVKPSPENRVAVLCGPPVMIRFTLASLKKLGYQSQHVYTTLENRMKCGVGKCGRCNVGPTYVCKEGPVFTAQQVEQMPPEM